MVCSGDTIAEVSMKLRGIRRTVTALALAVGGFTAFWGVGQHSIASGPARHTLAGEAMPPIPSTQRALTDK